VFRRGQANACYGSIREDDYIHRLTGDAALEIIRLRLKLKEAGVDYEPPSAQSAPPFLFLRLRRLCQRKDRLRVGVNLLI
jgi:hypothetical protein